MQHQIISTIRHSLNAAQSALTLLESLQGVDLGHERPAIQTTQVEQAVEAVKSVEHVEHVETVDTEAVHAVPRAVPSTFDVVMSELNHPRYTLRTLSELSNKLGVTQGGIFKMLDDEDVSYVIRHRRADGAQLIGLADRN